MAALKLTDGGHLSKMADCRIVRFDRAGNRVEELKPGDTGYGYWFGLVCRKHSDEPSDGRRNGHFGAPLV